MPGPSNVSDTNLVFAPSSLPTRHLSALLALASSGRVIKDNETKSPFGSHSLTGAHVHVGSFVACIHVLHLLREKRFLRGRYIGGWGRAVMILVGWDHLLPHSLCEYKILILATNFSRDWGSPRGAWLE